MISHRQRLETCLSGAVPDRTPVAFWRHFPVDDQTAGGLAAAHLAYQRTFDFDLLKVTPESGYCMKDWGLQDEWRGATEGTREATRRVIHSPEDWARLPALDPHAGVLGRQIEGLRLLRKELGPDTPILMTIFNPLSQARKLVGPPALFTHLRRHPDALHQGLRIITETTRRYIEAVAEAGCDGVFYAVQHAQYGLLNAQEFGQFCRPYDLQVLEAARPMWLNMLHLHGEEVMFDQVAEYPVQIINWHDQETWPSLAEGQTRFPGIVCGGIRRVESIVLGTPEQIQEESRLAVNATGGKRFMLGTGCVVPTHTPYGNLMAARTVVDQIPIA